MSLRRGKPQATVGTRAASAMPVRKLLVLGVAVLAAHAWVLEGAPLPGWGQPARDLRAPVALQTRAIAPPPAPVSPPVLSSPAVPKPLRKPAPRPRPRPAPPPVVPPEPMHDEPPPASVELAGDPAASSTMQDTAEAAAEPPHDATAADTHTAAPAPVPVPSGANRSAQPADAIRLLYDVRVLFRGITTTAKGEMLWQHDGQHYDLSLSIRMFLYGHLFTSASAGTLSPHGLTPERYAERRKSEQAAHFGTAEPGYITYSNNKPAQPLLAGAQDQVSMTMQVGALLAANPAAYPPGTQFELQVSGVGGADVWLFEVSEPEPLQLAGREWQTIRITPTLSRLSDRRIELWLAPELAYLPVRARMSFADGNVADLLLRETAPAAPPAPAPP